MRFWRSRSASRSSLSNARIRAAFAWVKQSRPFTRHRMRLPPRRHNSRNGSVSGRTPAPTNSVRRSGSDRWNVRSDPDPMELPPARTGRTSGSAKGWMRAKPSLCTTTTSARMWRISSTDYAFGTHPFEDWGLLRKQLSAASTQRPLGGVPPLLLLVDEIAGMARFDRETGHLPFGGRSGWIRICR